jgi:hypothetical protein
MAKCKNFLAYGKVQKIGVLTWEWTKAGLVEIDEMPVEGLTWSADLLY